VRTDVPSRRKPVIGLVGGIGAGKSEVAGILESLGAAVIDSDRLAHEQYSRPSVVATLRGWWGDSVIRPDGGVDRRAVADIVFRKPGELARLEELLYPLIDAERARLASKFDEDDAIRAIVIDAPKLYEAGVDRHCDAVIFVEAPESIRLDRVARSRGWTREELIRRESLQEPLDKKKARADYIIENRSGIEPLRTMVETTLLSVLDAFNRRIRPTSPKV
jgi:dephospho-CoA kinase